LSFWSPLFVVKQGQRHRLIFDLRRFNAQLRHFGFTLETLADIPALAARCAFASKIDLKSAYWQVPVSESLSSFLGTSSPHAPETQFCWRCLPFGLSVAPFAFAALSGAMVRAWRAKGIIVCAYLDDFLVLGRTLLEHAASVKVVVDDLLAAGFRISSSKAFILPYTTLDFLGMTLDFTAKAFRIPQSYADKLTLGAQRLLDGLPRPVPARWIREFVGRIAFASTTVPWLTFFRACLTAALSGSPPPSRVTLTEEAVEELSWWTTEAPRLIYGRSWSWRSIAHTKLFVSRGCSPMPCFILHSDASDSGIGMKLASGQLVSEPLPEFLPPSSPSTARELYAITRLVEREAFAKGTVVRVVTDSQGAARTALGATVAPSTAKIARRLFMAALQREVVVQVEWAPRHELEAVDAASRWDAVDGAHARLPITVVEEIVQRAWGPRAAIDMELFTAPNNRVSPTDASFATRYPYPGSVGDGLDPALWERARFGWAYPPFSLTRPVLRLATQLRPSVILILRDSPLARTTLMDWKCIAIAQSPLAPPSFRRNMTSAPPLAAFWLSDSDCCPRIASRHHGQHHEQTPHGK
jgi:hypothetical protein